MEAVALLANDLIMSGTSIRSFRHLEHQNLSIISEDIGRARSVQQFRRRRRRNTVVLEHLMIMPSLRYNLTIPPHRAEYYYVYLTGTDCINCSVLNKLWNSKPPIVSIPAEGLGL